ncbi:ribbon-helix-helix protein, CopG family [Thermococcus sp. Bubb.Bath]|uniref:ribbon-helix-helix protein, CopG family n=1 Tax=Thermococcus sp. Bubb.Bath TaxID=1638242 RepID=UPI001438C1B1|nr:ribbon-helix-helix protein, CopG family [Thermococcus sp. Bubb.Bath]NJF24552.1 ribbon-helix-helix protein, CopG family [Thermococcus sp. Bubb.Bath]
MARGKLNETGSYVWGFSIDDETHRMIEELSASLGLKNKSAVVRLAIRKLYRDTKI